MISADKMIELINQAGGKGSLFTKSKMPRIYINDRTVGDSQGKKYFEQTEKGEWRLKVLNGYGTVDNLFADEVFTKYEKAWAAGIGQILN